MFTPIPDHADQAVARLVSQYANSPLLQGLVRSLVGPIQDIETALAQLNTLRALAVATGIQLDNIGTIVGLTRPPGADDATYRQDLYAEIKVNTSQGQPEQAIQTFQLFTSATLVLLDEFFPAEVMIESDFLPPDQASADMIIETIERVLPAGVRMDGIVAFDPTEAFAYDGALPGLGYGDDSDPLVGGKYPILFLHNGFFEYDGDDPKGLGYGSSDDPLVGGEYAS